MSSSTPPKKQLELLPSSCATLFISSRERAASVGAHGISLLQKALSPWGQPSPWQAAALAP